MTIIEEHVEMVKDELQACPGITSWSITGEPNAPHVLLTARADDSTGQPTKVITVKLKRQSLLDLDYIKLRIKEAFDDRRKSDGR